MKTIPAIIEMPGGTRFKMELHKRVSSCLTLDRVLKVPCPYAYGLIQDTLCADGDALDVFVVTPHHLPALLHLDVVPVGILKCLDNGVRDDKIIAVIPGDLVEPNEVAVFAISKIRDYLETYKTGFQVISYDNSEAAMQCYEEAKFEWLAQFKLQESYE